MTAGAKATMTPAEEAAWVDAVARGELPGFDGARPAPVKERLLACAREMFGPPPLLLTKANRDAIADAADSASDRYAWKVLGAAGYTFPPVGRSKRRGPR
ncbi:MAG: hypothetical protein AB7I13_05970 [Vicinamibacterales bacterium]